KIKAENATEVKINQLKHLKQKKRELVKEYTNCYKTSAQAIKNQLRTDKKCDWYIKEKYNKDKTLNEHKALNISEENFQQNKFNVNLDSIVNRLATLNKGTNDNWTLNVLSKMKNKDNVTLYKIKHIEYESLGRLVFCSWINYWKQDDKRVNSTIDEKNILVVLRLKNEK
ncbi:17792_t:CDS:2, partial [Cetraspora pellucida]